MFCENQSLRLSQMRRTASLRAAPPPPPAGRGVASQRVRASHQPVSTFAACHPFTSSKHLQYTGSALVYFPGRHCCIVPKCETRDYWHFSPCFCKWRRKTVQFCGLYWHTPSGPLSKTQRAPTEGTNTHTHTTRSVSPAEDSPPVSLSHLSGCVSLLYYVRRMLRAERKSHRKMPLLLFFSPSFPRLTLPFCLQVSQRSPSVTSDQSQKSVESLFSARWVFGDRLAAYRCCSSGTTAWPRTGTSAL